MILISHRQYKIGELGSLVRMGMAGDVNRVYKVKRAATKEEWIAFARKSGYTQNQINQDLFTMQTGKQVYFWEVEIL